jgi:hypothetical protein
MGEWKQLQERVPPKAVSRGEKTLVRGAPVDDPQAVRSSTGHGIFVVGSMRRISGGTGAMWSPEAATLIFTRHNGQGLNCTCRVPCNAEEHVRAASRSDWECTSVRHGMGINRISLAMLNIAFGDKQVMV